MRRKGNTIYLYRPIFIQKIFKPKPGNNRYYKKKKDSSKKNNSYKFVLIINFTEYCKTFQNRKIKHGMERNEVVGKSNVLLRVVRFYVEGFRAMTLGKTLWAIILIKLFIMFFILRLFFFPNILQKNFDTDEERANAVIENLTNPNQSHQQSQEL